MSKCYATCKIPRLERENEPDGSKQLHVGGIDGISCQRQVLMTQKHWKWQEDSRASQSWTWAGHVARSMGDQDVHECITAACSREMKVLEWHAAFKNVESQFKFTRCSRHTRRSALALDQIGRAFFFFLFKGMWRQNG